MINKPQPQLGLFVLIMLITGSIDSIRNLPASALFGSTLIFFFIFAAIVFLIPTALVSSELAATWTQEGGVYGWVRKAFGEHTAMLAIWLQWINTMVWYPTILSFIAGTLAFLINPELAQHRGYLVFIILSTFWSLTLLNLRGVHTSARFASLCAIIGMVVPMILIIGMAAYWVLSGHPLQISLTAESMLPKFGPHASWISLTAIMTSFLGMELATVHVRHVKDPQHMFPKAIFASVGLILTTMILGSLAIAAVLPHEQIGLVDGVMQAFTNFFAAYHLSWMIPVITIMLLIGSLGGMINWIISPARGMLLAAEHGFLPQFFAKQNKHGVAHRMLITQAILVSFVCLAFLLMPSVNGSYWLLTALSTELYMMMYILMFAAAIWLRHKHPHVARPFQIPGGIAGISAVSLLGIFGCIITLIVGFFPPAGIDVGGSRHYEHMFALGIIVMLAPVLLLYGYRWLQRTETSALTSTI